MEHLPFENKTAIVTGASSGIGRETALALALRGAHVALASRRVELLEEVAHQVEGLGRKTMVIPTDVSVQAQVDSMVAEVLERWDRVDILIVNAGQYIRAPIDTLTVDIIEHAMAINFYGGIYTTLAVLPHMKVQNSGHIVMVTTMDSKKGLPPDAPYVAAKFALTGFTDVLRQELHSSGVYVSNILPGRVDSDMIEDLRFLWISKKIPPKDVADAIVKAILKRKPEVIVPFHAGFLHYINAFSPSLGDWIVRFLHLQGWDDGRETAD